MRKDSSLSFSGIFWDVRYLFVGGLDLNSKCANRASRSANGRRRHRYLSNAAVGNGRARPPHLRRQRLRLLPQRAISAPTMLLPTSIENATPAPQPRPKWGQRRAAPRAITFSIASCATREESGWVLIFQTSEKAAQGTLRKEENARASS